MWQKILISSVLALMLSACKPGDGTTKPSQDRADTHGTPKDWKFTLTKGDAGAGRDVFVELECYKCHEVTGEKFPNVAESDKGVGPELAQMAGMHPVEFFAESIVNPNAVIDHDAKERGYLGDDGKSKMPDYGDSITFKQLADLASYLAGLKNPSGHKH
jgi:mono/diheme cytochrome c family protein